MPTREAYFDASVPVKRFAEKVGSIDVIDPFAAFTWSSAIAPVDSALWAAPT